jgi:predicted nucleic acid-binding protein
MRAQNLPKSLQLYSRPTGFTSSLPDMPMEPSPAGPDEPAWVVIDTNVALDLLVFDDSSARALAGALKAGRLQPLATLAMFDELADVLSRPFLADWPVDPAEVLRQARALCREVPSAPSLPAPRGADPDDQKFVDLAWAWPTLWLFSRDRAVLALARKAQAHGLGIVTPAAWAARQAAAAAASSRPA